MVILTHCRNQYIIINIQSNVFTMENKNKLSAAEIICLQMNGVSTKDIINTDADKFQSLLEKKFMYRPTLSRTQLMVLRQKVLGIETITIHDEDFPSRLLAIGDDCPAVVYCRGNTDLLKKNKTVGIVGKRTYSQTDYEMGYELAKSCSNKGNTIVSGFTMGSETAAHRGAMSVDGETIAVVACGLNRVDLKPYRELMEDVLAHNGLILSEWPLNVKANPYKKIACKRIISALSDTVILTRCTAKGRSLYAMEFARMYGKECLAVTFPHRNVSNGGNYALIDSGHAIPISIQEYLL